ncbi:hypothetical protein V1517DRAFT_329681 [Lipomyces orientalis]|uniref:Uncharacterized protein n=1 Tax=Lipomyces orientalis TaxID=1233043 RepID=A0ACC3THA7_9ASCO
MENEVMMPDTGASASAAQKRSKAADLLAAPSRASDRASGAGHTPVGPGQSGGSELTTTKTTKQPAPLGVKTNRSTASAQRASSTSSSSSRPLTAGSAARTSTARAPTSGSSSHENATPSTFTVASRLLAPTAASKAHAAASSSSSGGTADTRAAPIRRGARTSAPAAAVGHPTGPGQRPATKQPPAAVAARPFGATAASSSRALSTNTKSVVQRDVKTAATGRHESMHAKPARQVVQNVKATLGEQGQREAAEELVLAAAENAQKAAAAEREKSQAGIIERDNKISELSAELEASTKKLQDSTSLTQQQADCIADLQAKHRGLEDKITALEKELADANDKHDAALASLQIELANSKQLHSAEVENVQSQVSAEKTKYEEQIASLSQKLASVEEQINLRERELLGNSKVIKSLQDELNTTVETLEDAKKVELEKLARSYDGWRDNDYVGGLEKELETLKASLRHDTEAALLRENMANLEVKNSQHKDLIAALETKVEVLTATIASQGEQNTNLSASNADLAKEVERHVRQLSETNQKLQDVLAQQSQLETLAAVLQSEKADADKSVADMRQIFGELERNVDSLNSELKI